VSKHIETFKSWSESFHEDVVALKALVEAPQAHVDARKLAAAALNYLVTRMDLVPDHEQGIGALDDVMILRMCVSLASAHPFGDLPGDAEVVLARMANDAERMRGFLGGELFDKLKKYASRLTETAVRGRHPSQIVDDDAARAALYGDVDLELKRSVPVVITDAADAELRLKAYLTHKLK
jgi:uncharacterized membrane protein YkvA (DUF1232 family)